MWHHSVFLFLLLCRRVRIPFCRLAIHVSIHCNQNLKWVMALWWLLWQHKHITMVINPSRSHLSYRINSLRGSNAKVPLTSYFVVTEVRVELFCRNDEAASESFLFIFGITCSTRATHYCVVEVSICIINLLVTRSTTLYKQMHEARRKYVFKTFSSVWNECFKVLKSSQCNIYLVLILLVNHEKRHDHHTSSCTAICTDMCQNVIR